MSHLRLQQVLIDNMCDRKQTFDMESSYNWSCSVKLENIVDILSKKHLSDTVNIAQSLEYIDSTVDREDSTQIDHLMVYDNETMVLLL